MEKKTGKEYRGRRFTIRELVDVVPDPTEQGVYDSLFDLLSSASHVDLSTVSFSFSEESGAFYHRQDDPKEGFIVANACSAMLFSELSLLPQVSRLAKRDARYIARKLATNLTALAEPPAGIVIFPESQHIRKKLLQIGAGEF